MSMYTEALGWIKRESFTEITKNFQGVLHYGF